MITIRDVAEAAGVSIATVSRVLSNSDYPVSDKTRERILEVAAHLGYSPNRAARSLRTERSSVIGVILDNFNSLWAPFIIRGLQNILQPNGYLCLVVNIPWEHHSQAKVVQDLIGHSVDGFIFVETWHRVSESMDMLRGRPYAIVHRLFHETDVNSVLPDEHYNTTLVVNHLIQLGHRRIAYISGAAEFFSSGERLAAYRHALTMAGIEIDTELIETGDWSIPRGYQATQNLLALKQPPTAIVGANDHLTYGAILAIQDAGLSVPDDIAVVGYDNDEVAQISNPTITTVSLPLFEMGQAAAEHLLRMLSEEAPPFEELRIKGELIIRQSCGAPQGQSALARNYTRNSPEPVFPQGIHKADE
jgi:DNA-binding LacI/PurR family transcriptional regulator